MSKFIISLAIYFAAYTIGIGISDSFFAGWITLLIARMLSDVVEATTSDK